MKYDEIDDALDITPTEVKSEKIVKKEPEVTEIVTSTQEQLKKDYEYTRGNLYSLIEKGQEAVDGILELAQESDSPPERLRLQVNLLNMSVMLPIN